MSQSPQGGTQMETAEKELHAEPTITDGLLVYGAFPKSECKDRVILSKAVLAKADKRGYFLIDGNWYFSYQGQVFLVEPLRWHIMSRKRNLVRAFCENLPFARNFTEKPAKYKDSDIRNYLHKEFTRMAFGKDRAVKSIELMSVEEFNKIPKDNPIFPTFFSDFAFAAGATISEGSDFLTGKRWKAIDWWLASDAYKGIPSFAIQDTTLEFAVDPVNSYSCACGYQDRICGVRPIIEIKMK